MRKPIIYQIRREVFNERDLRMMVEGVIKHRENYILYGAPYAPSRIDDEIDDQKTAESDDRKAAESDDRAREYNDYIHELEQTRAQYVALLQVVEEENERIKHEQRTGHSFRDTII
jgi:hypothetical protein